MSPQPPQAKIPAARSAHFDLRFAPGPIQGCPEKKPEAQLELWSRRLEALHARFCEVLGAEPAAEPRLVVALLGDRLEHARLTEELIGLEAQGIGSRDPARGACVLHNAAGVVRDDAALQRLLVHQVAHLLAARLAPAGALDPAWGWFEEGLAAWLEADLCLGGADSICYQERAQPPRPFWGGNPRVAARSLLAKGRLPPLADLAGREADDLDLEQRTTAFAFVDWLQRAAGVPITHALTHPEPTLLALVRAAKAGEPVREALRRARGIEIGALDAALRTWLEKEYAAR